MNSVIGYVVMRYETPLGDSPGIASCIEQVFVSEEKAKQHKLRFDPKGQGFEYHCPCGCGEAHYRAWYVEPIVLNLEE